MTKREWLREMERKDVGRSVGRSGRVASDRVGGKKSNSLELIKTSPKLPVVKETNQF